MIGRAIHASRFAAGRRMPLAVAGRVGMPLAPTALRALRTSSKTLAPITPPPSPPSPSSSANVGRATHVKNKPLPTVPNTLPYLVGFVAAAIASWSAFTIYATNKEKLSSSIFKSITTQVKANPQVLSLLDSNAVVLKREVWLGGQCRVKGAVNMMQGRVDLSFKVTKPEDEARTATVYFTSIRAHKHAPFEILRFLVVDDQSGESVSLLEGGAGLSSIDVETGDIV